MAIVMGLFSLQMHLKLSLLNTIINSKGSLDLAFERKKKPS
jgi:hypothetical protein